MHIVGWTAFGLLVGVAARFLMPGRDVAGFVIAAVLGMAGAVGGGLVGGMTGWYGDSLPAEFLVAGAVIPLIAYRLALHRTRAS